MCPQSLLEPALGVGPHLAAVKGDDGDEEDGSAGDNDSGARIVYLDAGCPEVSLSTRGLTPTRFVPSDCSEDASKLNTSPLPAAILALFVARWLLCATG